MSAKIISFADVRATAEVRSLVNTQNQIDAAARNLLQGRRATDLRLEDLLDSVDNSIEKLRKLSKEVASADLRRLIQATCKKHRAWALSPLGSEEERNAAFAYLDSVERLAFVAMRKT